MDYTSGAMRSEVPSEGTQAAAIALSDPLHMRELLRRVAPDNRWPGNFQLVLKVKLRTQEPFQITYLSHRELRHGL